ncbi:MAG: hypothetical protein M0R30_10370 [Methanoregula sp.]|jgi:uncharacterized protein YwgA|uniref:hypothetical protein n=1 Tax=Methanoregula sp. TaxID=2052170 RepID=UPI0025F3FD1B|nr:hypothetical protein [Methanoregula sp.]MCK9632036.1 hypothetical protein [Methanoregula sp.]
MEKRKKVIAFFKELSFGFDISRFDDRLIAQKLVCLLELNGIDLGYSCSLYVRGPYSPDLTKDLFAFTPEFENQETGSRLNAAEREVAGELGRIFGLRPVPLEVGATYGYYAIRQNCDPLEALRQVKRLKPFYSEAQIALGISKAKEFLYTPSQKDLEELKKETGIWQRASLKSLEH